LAIIFSGMSSGAMHFTMPGIRLIEGNRNGLCGAGILTVGKDYTGVKPLPIFLQIFYKFTQKPLDKIVLLY
jgi:hypothetical protein